MPRRCRANYFEILKLWVRGKGKPLSWDSLIDLLKSVELGTLASDVRDELAIRTVVYLCSYLIFMMLHFLCDIQLKQIV